jgi:protein-S-isoprenylcysteine O-methyltransferase Ste14
MAANLHADSVLLRLRREGGYGVPRGGLFRWVSCPNYLAEMVEWVGWALATWSPAGAAFATYTTANLLPRAVVHHRWYRARFPDYPPERRALIPFLL